MDKFVLQKIKYRVAEYIRLKSDGRYTEVKLNARTGGLLAIHREHNEGMGKRNIEYKIRDASQKNAKVIVLYYHDKRNFSLQSIKDGYNSYLRNSKNKKIQAIYYIVDGELFRI
jgi:hypothetical protein